MEGTALKNSAVKDSAVEIHIGEVCSQEFTVAEIGLFSPCPIDPEQVLGTGDLELLLGKRPQLLIAPRQILRRDGQQNIVAVHLHVLHLGAVAQQLQEQFRIERLLDGAAAQGFY